MMGLFKRKKREEPEAVAVADEPEEQSSTYQAWSPDGNDQTDVPAQDSRPQYEPQELVMETPQADAAELESIANAGTFEEQITAALKKVYDPEIPVDIYEMGLIYGVEVSEAKDVSIQMTLTSPGCPVAGQMPGMVQHAVHSFVQGVGDVEVEIVWDPPWTPDRMSEAAQLELGFM
jgi:FeS assembly SUF system protein